MKRRINPLKVAVFMTAIYFIYKLIGAAVSAHQFILSQPQLRGVISFTALTLDPRSYFFWIPMPAFFALSFCVFALLIQQGMRQKRRARK